METFFKKKRIIDNKYLKWLTTQKCIVNRYGDKYKDNDECCGQVVGHHAGESGVGMKCDDKDSIPLCWCHHTGDNGIHTIGKKTWLEKYDKLLRLEIKWWNAKYEQEGNKLKK